MMTAKSVSHSQQKDNTAVDTVVVRCGRYHASNSATVLYICYS